MIERKMTGGAWQEIYNKADFLLTQGVMIVGMECLTELVNELGIKEFVTMLGRGGDVNGMVAGNESVASWRFDTPFDTEQDCIFIFDSEIGRIAVSGNISDAPSFISDMWLDNEYEQWRMEYELCRAS